MIHSVILFLSGLSLFVFGYFTHILIIGLGVFFLVNGVLGYLIVRFEHRKQPTPTYYDEILY